MATSGSLTTSAYSNRSITFSWSEKSQSIADNTTTISWSLKGSGSASGYYLAQNITLKLDGKVVFEHLKSEDGQIQLWNDTSVASGTYTFTHASDGSKSFTAYLEAGIYVWEPNCSGSKTFTLDDIPRQATITSAPNFTDEDNPVIKYSNPAGSAVDTLQACIASSDGKTTYASYRNITKTGTSYTFSLTETERNNLRSATTTSNTLTVKFYVKTVIGDNTFYSTSSKTLSIINANPTLSPTIVDTDSYTTALTGDSSKLVKYFSDAKITIGASALKKATVSSKSCVNGSKTLSADGTFTNVESNSFKFSVKDSRGNTASKTLTPTMVNYVKLTCNLKEIKVSTDGVMSFSIGGNYFNGSFGSVSNSLTVQYRYKTSGGSYGSWVTLTATKSGNTYTASGTVSGLDYQTTYVFQARVSDKIYDGTNQSIVTTSAKNVSAKPVFDWGADDFNFNVPVNSTYGSGMAFAHTHPTSGVKVGLGVGEGGTNRGIWDSTLGKWIFYCNGTNTYIGNSSKTYTFGVNNLLASSGLYMNASQSMNLSSPVSAQAHGIILVFSYYSSNAAQDEQFITCFVPKRAVATHDGCGFSFTLNSHWYNGMKYLYISDSKITGHANNTGSYTVGGITYSNSNFVLRHVFGV